MVKSLHRCGIYFEFCCLCKCHSKGDICLSRSMFKISDRLTLCKTLLYHIRISLISPTRKPSLIGDKVIHLIDSFRCIIIPRSKGDDVRTCHNSFWIQSTFYQLFFGFLVIYHDDSERLQPRRSRRKADSFYNFVYVLLWDFLSLLIVFCGIAPF